MLADAAGLLDPEPSGDEGGVGYGRGAGMLPTAPDEEPEDVPPPAGAAERLSGMKELPSAGGLGGAIEGASAGVTGRAGGDVGPGTITGAGGVEDEAGAGARLGEAVCDAGEGDGFELRDEETGGSVEETFGIGCNFSAEETFGIGSTFSGVIDGRGAILSFTLGSRVFWVFAGCPGKIAVKFGPADESWDGELPAAEGGGEELLPKLDDGGGAGGKGGGDPDEGDDPGRGDDPDEGDDPAAGDRLRGEREPLPLV